MIKEVIPSAVAATVSTAAPAYMPPLLRPLAFCDAPNKNSTDAITVPILHTRQLISSLVTSIHVCIYSVWTVEIRDSEVVAHSPRDDAGDEDDGLLGLGENGAELAVADGCHCRDGGLRHEQEEGGADPQSG
jgi:hypothetical protein